MRAYIIRRLLLIIPTLFILSILVFLSVRFIPGDAIDAMLGKNEFIGAGVDRPKRSSTCWVWTCPSTCSTDAGSEVSSCTAASAAH